MAKFIVIEEATQQSTDLWEGVVEYDGKNVSYRFYDGHDEQVAYVLIDEEGWVYDGQKHPLINVINAAIKEIGMPPEFGSVGEVNEIEDEIVKEYS
jgi:hypothetical protein